MYIVAGKYKNHKLRSPKGMETRPTTNRLREALFNICQSYIENARFLDLFAGSGAIGLEALSRGAKEVTFIDSHRESIHCIKQNIESLQLETNARAIQGDVFTLIPKFEKQGVKFDIIYADPPYEQGHGEQLWSQKLLQLIDQHQVLEPGGYLFIEESSSMELTLDGLSTLEVVSIRKMGRASLLQFKNHDA